MRPRQHSVELFITTILLTALFYPNSNQLNAPAPIKEVAANLEIKPPNISEEAVQRGLTFIHSEKSSGISDLIDALGAGACILDFNGDSYMDIFFVPGSRSKRFYGRTAWWQSPSPTSLYINDHFGYFKPAELTIDQLSDQPGMGCTVADFDKDGDPDIAISFIGSVQILWNDRREKLVAETVYSEDGYWPTSLSASDADRDGLTDLYISGYLKYGKENKTFEDKMSFDTSEKFRFSANLYPGSKNVTLLNRSSHFQPSNSTTGEFSDSRTLQGTISGHLSTSNNPVFILANDAGSVSQISSADQPPIYQTNAPIKSSALIPYRNNEILLIFGTERGHLPKLLSPPFNQQDIARSVIESSAITLQDNNFGAAGADINNDGLTDILFANGYPTPDSDTRGATQGQRNSALLQTPAGKFKPFTPKSLPRYSSRSAVRIDIDNDGDHDILFTNNNNLPELWVNNSTISNWIGVSGLMTGDIVTLHTNKTLRTHLFQNEGFLSMSDPRISFHIDKSESVNLLKVQRANKIHLLENPKARAYNGATQNNAQPFQHSVAGEYSISAAHKTMWRSLAGESTSQLSFHFTQLDTKNKILWVNLSEKLKLPMSYQILAQALRDPSLEIRLLAIKALGNIKTDETSQILALALEKTSDPKEICEISNAFARIFETEESNINSKQLGLTSLIKKAYNDPQTCLIASLSKSRSKRAAMAISEIAKASRSDYIAQFAQAAQSNLRLNGKPSANTQIVKPTKNNSPSSAYNANSIHKDNSTTQQLLQEISDRNLAPKKRIEATRKLHKKLPQKAITLIKKMLESPLETEQYIALQSIKTGDGHNFTKILEKLFASSKTTETNYILAGYLLAEISPSLLLNKLNNEIQ